MNSSRRNRSSRSNRGFLGRLYAPLNRGLQAVGEIGGEGAKTVGNVFGRTVTGVRRAGSTATGRLNQGVSELVRGKSRKGGRRNRSERKSRKNRTMVPMMRKNRGMMPMMRKSRKNRSERSRRNRH
jgi:hypothetical protein